MTDVAGLTRAGFGVVGVRVGVAATLYLADTASPQARRRIAGWLDEQRARLGADLRWARSERSGRWQEIQRHRATSAWLPERDPGKSWEVLMHGGNDARDASDVRLEGFGAEGWSGGWGYLRWACPATAFEADPRGFRDRVIAAATTLQPRHGYAGWTVLESPELEFEQAFQPEVWALVQRHVGLDVGAPVSHLQHLREAIKGAAWLVILDDAWLARCPELLALAGHDTIEVHRYPGGALVEAGPRPELGGALGEAPPAPLVAVARALAPIRVQQHPSLHFAGAGRMHQEETRRWLGRFEADG